MTTNLNRRAFAISSMFAAVAVPVAVQGAPAGDAELIALGKEMDRLDAIMADALRRAKPAWAEMQRELLAFRQLNGHVPNSEYTAMFARVAAKYPIAFPHPDDVSGMQDGPARRIMALEATTLAGLAVKARMAKSGCNDMWAQNDDDADWDHLILRSLVDSVLRLAAVQS